MTRSATPKTRLADYPVGSKVILEGVDRTLVVANIRDDGYVDLKNLSGFVSVTASPGHEVRIDK